MAVGVLMVVALVLLLTPPVYRAQARLRLNDPPPSVGVNPTAGILSFLQLGGDPFANDLELLSSRTLAEAVVRDAALSVTLDAPRGWHRDSVFLALSVGDSTVKARWDVHWRADGITVRRTAPRDSLVGTFPPGDPVRFGGVTAVFRAPPRGAPASVELATVPLDEAVRVTSGRLQVERTRREANVLELEYRSSDPGLARAVAASAVQSFVALRSALFKRESGETMDSLRTVALETARELREAEEAMAALQRETGLVAPDAQSEALVERYETLAGGLEEARAERALLEAQAARAEGVEDLQESWATLLATPAFLDNPTVGELLTSLNELARARTEILSRRTPESREARTVEAQIRQLDGALRALALEYRQGLDEGIEQLARRLQSLEARLEDLPAAGVELARRQRDVRVLSELLVLTEQRLRQEELREALSFSSVQVIDPPALRYRPVWPRKRLGAAVGLLLATGAGLAAMGLMDRADRTVRTASAVRALTGAPVLATPVRRGAGPRLTEEEVAAIRGGPGGVPAVVACMGAEDDARSVADAVTPGAGARSVGSYAAASGVAPRGSRVVLVARVGATPRAALERVATWLRQAELEIAGTVLVCDDAGQAEAAWR